jgi:hypothetical protein
LSIETKEEHAADEMLREAEKLVVETGVTSWQPFIHEQRAALANVQWDRATRVREACEAHRLFTQIGARIRAEQVAKELGS